MVNVYSWNPLRIESAGNSRFRLPTLRRPNNSGDTLGPLIVRKVAERNGIQNLGSGSGRLLSVGSVLHFAKSGDTIWGTGLNGKIHPSRHDCRDLDVRAVRGPRTAKFLTDRGVSCPEVYGDPVLLLPTLVPELRVWAKEPKRYPLTVIPDFNEHAQFLESKEIDGRDVISPRRPVLECLERIARSEFVAGSSLHAVVVAESLGIPARVIHSRHEPELKNRDYFEGTGRFDVEIADSLRTARAMGGASQVEWDGMRLLHAFPTDLWLGQTDDPCST